jgi:hypothetical protein
MTKLNTTTRVLATAFFLALASYATPSAADPSRTASAEERAACTPDVFRLCASEIPNVTRIIGCMKRNRPKLSPKCAAVFNVRAGKETATRSISAPAAN